MTPPLDAWGLSGAPVPLPGGHRNTVLRVGNHVVKSTRRTEAAVAWLLPVMEALAMRGLHAPRPMRSARGALVVQGWTCEPFVHGAPCDASALRRVWPYLSTAFGQRPGFAHTRALRYVPCSGDIDLSTVPNPLLRAVRRAWAALPQTAPRVVHGDLNRTNLIRSVHGVTVIDWDEARLDHPGFDRVALGRGTTTEARAALAMEIASCWRPEPARARALARRFLLDRMRQRKSRPASC
ncbi:phosphotransferase [uncultured Tateyamaria sp.]|uniref:phosphotransferase n=1 Tax=Tateyamaria sp. 1078 TaxID=3417464 RepID=UPI00262F6E84|nr:phosphotransferase [uncultured Tateyamaria sp.]